MTKEPFIGEEKSQEKESQKGIEQILKEASSEKLLSNKEYNRLIQEVKKKEDINNIRNKIFEITQTARKATEEYTKKMNDSVKNKILTEEDAEEGMKIFQESDVETKERVFVETMNERVHFARNQLQNYLKTLEDNKNLFSVKEFEGLEKSFLNMSSIKRDEEVEKTPELLKERQILQNSYENLLEHELMDGKKDRSKRFKKLSLKERKKETKKLKEEIKKREKSQDLIRKETEASKDFCKIEKWKDAIPHCRKALKIINKLDYKNNVEWFSYRYEVITDLISKLEEKTAKESVEMRDLNPELVEGVASPEASEIKKQDEDISEKRKKQLSEMLIKGFMRSKKASATTIGAFVHSLNQETIRNNQKDVDKKNDLAVKDHKEKNEDEIVRLESRVENISREKASALAYKKEFDQKTIAIVNTDNRILSREEGDRSVNSNLKKVLLEEIKTLSISPQEKKYLRSSVKALDQTNYGRKIRSDGAEGLNEHESKLGKDFEKNKNNFAHDVVDTII